MPAPPGYSHPRPAARAAQDTMAGPKIPYPTSPAKVPDGLTDYPATYKAQQNLLLVGLFVFLMLYVALIFLCLLAGTYCAFTVTHLLPLKIAGIVLSGTFFLFLVKGFFKRSQSDKTLYIEVADDEQPVLFGFIHQLCEELGAPEPRKVWIAPDVNAAVTYRTNLINLFVQPEKDLVIGLGLVNAVNMSEFKAVLAHEFGHFGQSSYASSYTYVASRIIIDLVEGEDWFDRVVGWCQKTGGVAGVFGYTVGGMLWAGRKVLGWMLKAITLQRLAVSREQEFHADSVAASVAGSDAVVHCLLRAEFGHICMMQALHDLSQAADHKIYTKDLYLHQDRAAPVVRRKKKEPNLGLPPQLDEYAGGRDVTVFDREREELEDDSEIPPMWRTHPSNADREESVKELYVAAAVDHRSPWILFTDTADLKERVSYKFYRMVHKIPKSADLADAAEVQKFIDGEHADTTYDPKYEGIYDDRPLEPGEIAELNQLVRESPWEVERVRKVFDKLYEGCRGKAEEYDDLRKERSILENTPGEHSPRTKKKIKELDDQLDRVWEWYKSLDRRVYLVHVQMAARVNSEWKEELVERYRFQMEVQRMYQDARYNQGRAFAFATALFNMENPHPEFVNEVMQVLRQSWRALKNILKDARDINLPAMRNFEEGERLADFILPDKLVPELPLTYVKGKWVAKLLDQLDAVRTRCFRLHFKSVGGILALQEKIAAAWQEKHAPGEAALVAEVVAETAEAIPVAAAVIAEAVPVGEILEAIAVEEPVSFPAPPVVPPTPPVRLVPPVPPVSIPPPVPVVSTPPVVPVPPADSAPPPEPVVVPAVLITAPPSPPVPAFATFVAPVLPLPPLPSADFLTPANNIPTSSAVTICDESVSLAGMLMPRETREVPPVTAAKPAKNGRPAVKITVVRPGEKSPFA